MKRRRVGARTVAARLRSLDRVGATLGMELIEVRRGFARVRMTARQDMLNGHAIVHGGMIFVLADTALAYAANSHNTVAVTQHASVTFLSPVREGETLIAQARERAIAGRSGVYDVEVVTQDGRALAILNGLTRALPERIVR